MIVCLDTSGSMVGIPEKIAYSLLMKLLEIADRQRRPCFLIAFSVSICPIDVRKERARLLDFFSTTSCGDTDATRMLKATFDLLQSKKEYMNADVLWITDFKIPLPSPKLTDRILEYRKADTHFYGLQLGIAENEWIPFFDRVYRVDYPVRTQTNSHVLLHQWGGNIAVNSHDKFRILFPISRVGLGVWSLLFPPELSLMTYRPLSMRY